MRFLTASSLNLTWFGRLLVFLVLDEGTVPLTHHLPVGLAAAPIFVSAYGWRCRLVEAYSTSSSGLIEEAFASRRTSSPPKKRKTGFSAVESNKRFTRPYFFIYSKMPKAFPSGSSARAHQPNPGISIFSTTILPPSSTIFLL